MGIPIFTSQYQTKRCGHWVRYRRYATLDAAIDNCKQWLKRPCVTKTRVIETEMTSENPQLRIAFRTYR